jgi:hypothetical protein
MRLGPVRALVAAHRPGLGVALLAVSEPASGSRSWLAPIEWSGLKVSALSA